MQKAARQIMVDYHGVFPSDYEEIRSLTGIGSYTAGAISSFAFGKPEPAVDGNVLRVLTRILADHSDIMKQSTKTKMEKALRKVIPEGSPSDFNQGLGQLSVCLTENLNVRNVLSHIYAEQGKRGGSVNSLLRRKRRQDG